MMATGTAFVVEDVRGYGPTVVERLKQAVEQNCPARPDPLHPHLSVLECTAESFYIAPHTGCPDPFCRIPAASLAPRSYAGG